LVRSCGLLELELELELEQDKRRSRRGDEKRKKREQTCRFHNEGIRYSTEAGGERKRVKGVRSKLKAREKS